MNDTAPPPVTPHGDASHQDVPNDFFVPALRSDPESFPVLKAFQEYIEEERERARRRIVTLSIVAIGALVVVISGFLVVGSIVIGGLARRNEQLQEVVMQAAVRDAGVSAATSAERQAELSRLQDMVLRLQQEQAELQGSLGALHSLPEALAERLAAALTEASVAQAAADETAAAPPPSPPPSPPPPRAAAPFGPGTGRAAERPPDAAETPSAATQSARPAAPEPQDMPPPPPEGLSRHDAPASADRPAASDPDRRVSIEIGARVQELPRIVGYAPSQVTLVTDQGIAIPWRVVVPE